jgi:hypothetical protein
MEEKTFGEAIAVPLRISILGAIGVALVIPEVFFSDSWWALLLAALGAAFAIAAAVLVIRDRD